MLRRLVLLCALLLAPLMAGPLQAHQQKITISTVSVNPRTGMIEVVHQVPVHDLDRDGPAHAQLIGSIHLAHPTRSDQLPQHELVRDDLTHHPILQRLLAAPHGRATKWADRVVFQARRVTSWANAHGKLKL